MTDRTREPHGFPPVEDYALIGNCASAALVARDGSIEWLCWPRFDSPSLFAAVLDRERGGSFRVGPVAEAEVSRRYVEDTVVLETRFRTAGGVLALRDAMAVSSSAHEGAIWPEHQILREVSCVEGSVRVAVRLDPRFDYGRRRIAPEDRGRLGWFYSRGREVFLVRSEIPLARSGGALAGEVELAEGERRTVSLSLDLEEPATIPPLVAHGRHELEETERYWRGWSRGLDYDGPHRDAVLRSALTLKLLTYSASGAIVAAPTTSLPEQVGGARNWDYRFCWLRDAAFTLRALLELGFRDEGKAFLSWLLYTARRTMPELHVLYDVFGRRVPAERELSHLRGYRGSRPVRVGNAAKEQLQLDLYGVLVSTVFEFCDRGGELGTWQSRMFAELGHTVCRRWREPDNGIWEVRSGRFRHTHSNAMCWVALDRLVKLGEAGHVDVPEREYARVRDAIRDEIEAQGFDEERGSYVAVFGGDHVDASLLLLSTFGYVAADDPRMLGTWERIRAELGRGVLLQRYPHAFDDGLPGSESTFGICTFWAVEYLARLGRLDEARRTFESVLELANDVGLFGEELDAHTGRALGNFPQGLTHIGLVNAALTLAEVEGRRREAGLEGRRRVPPPRGRGESSQDGEERRRAPRGAAR